MEKVLTIVVPTYNMEAYLDRCLTSLIVEEPLMDKLEVIVVNDGSKDRSSEIAHGYESRFPNTFHVIDKENGNYGSCVNRGIAIATGKYFRILDADDYVDNAALNKFIVFLDDCDSDVVFTNHKMLSKASSRDSSFPNGILLGHKYEINSFNIHDLKLSWLILMHRMTFRLETIKESKLAMHEGISYSDTDYCFYPCTVANSFIFNDAVLYQYDCSRDGQTMSLGARTKSLSHMEVILTSLMEHYVELRPKICPNRRAILTECIFSISQCIYRTILVDSQETKELNSFLKKIDELLKVDIEVYLYVETLLYNKIPYIKVWRKYRLYNSCIMFKIYNRLYNYWTKF